MVDPVHDLNPHAACGRGLPDGMGAAIQIMFAVSVFTLPGTAQRRKSRSDATLCLFSFLEEKGGRTPVASRRVNAQPARVDARRIRSPVPGLVPVTAPGLWVRIAELAWSVPGSPPLQLTCFRGFHQAGGPMAGASFGMLALVIWTAFRWVTIPSRPDRSACQATRVRLALSARKFLASSEFSGRE